MAIRANKTQKPSEVNQEPVTETQEERPVMPEHDSAPPQQELPQEAQEVVVRQQTTTDVAVSSGMPDMPAITSLENALPAEDFGNLFPRVTGSNGVLMCEKNDLGSFIDVQVISTSDRWMITPDAEQTDKKAKKLCRASYDGKTIPGWDGEPDIPIEDWIKEIEKAGYKANKVSKYKDVFCSVFNVDKPSAFTDELDMVQVSVSPTAIKTFRAFIIQAPMKVARGTMLKSHQNCMRITPKGVTGDVNYTVLEFKTVPLDVLEGYTPVVA